MTVSEKLFHDMLAEMEPVFWDTDLSALDREKNAPYIIARLLNMGGMAGYCWVKKLYSPEEITWAVIHRRDLKPVVRNLMAQQYGIPRDKLIQPPAWRERTQKEKQKDIKGFFINEQRRLFALEEDRFNTMKSG